MTKIFSTLIVLLTCISCFCQYRSSKNLEKWDKAIVNIEGEGHMAMTKQERDELFKKMRRDTTYDKLSDWQLERLISTYSFTRRPIQTGTAIYLLDKGKRYLITAAHVIRDDVGTRDQRQFEDMLRSQGILKAPDPSRTSREIKLIRRYNSRDYFEEGYRWFVLLIESYTSECNSYEWSEADDLAVISLDFNAKNKRFANSLDTLGFVPITLSDINFNAQYHIGGDIMCIGFPSPSFVQNSPTPFEGKSRTLPIFSYGRIASSHDSLNVFWGDISIYPGNSGGPVIRNNKIIGIVSAQSTVNVEDEKGPTPLRARVPFGKFVKPQHLKRLIDKIQTRERNSKCDD